MLKVGDRVRCLPSIVENYIDEAFVGSLGTVTEEDGDALAEQLDDQLVRVRLDTGESLPATLHHRFERVEKAVEA